MSKEERGFTVGVQDDYIHLETWGVPTEKDVADPVNAALELAATEKIDKLLDDIRGVNGDSISLMVQAKGIGVLWKLRRFKKAAIVISSEELTWMFTASLQELGLGLGGWNIRNFGDIESAREWLDSDAPEKNRLRSISKA